MQITEIKKRRHLQTEIFFSEGDPVKIATAVFEERRISVGDRLDEDALCALISESDSYRAKEKALYLLEYRDHSRKELEDKIGRSLPRESAREAVNRMEELGLLDDDRYAGIYAKHLYEKKKLARRGVVRELLQKGIDRDRAEEIAEELEPDASEAAAALLRKKYPDAGVDEGSRRRAAAALSRLGYGYDDIKKAISALAEDTEWE